MAVIKKSIYGPITSSHVKTSLLYYFRSVRQFPVACTEYKHKDVYAVNLDSALKIKAAYEIEVKISKADLYKELEKTKHQSLIPDITHAYLAVPCFLVEEAINLCNTYLKKYGVIRYTPETKVLETRISIVRPAKKQALLTESSVIITDLLSRMSNEIFTLRKRELL